MMEPGIPDELGSIASPQSFHDALNEVRARAGHPSLRRLCQMAGAHGHTLAPSTLSDALTHTNRLPSWKVVEALLRACGVTADAAIDTWRRTWNRISCVSGLPDVDAGSNRDQGDDGSNDRREKIALARQANEAIEAASARSRLSAAEVLARLVGLATLDDYGRYSIRRMPYDPDEAAWVEAVRTFAEHRLLVTGKSENVEWVTVTYERLFTAWPKLEDALHRHDQSIRSIRSIERATDEWSRAGRAAHYLWDADRLAAVDRIDEARYLFTDARAFLAESRRRVAAARKRRRLNIAGLAALCLVLLLSAALNAVWWSAARSEDARVLGGCDRIDIFTGHVDSPYYQYAQVLKRLVEKGFPGSTVVVQRTSGTADNINRLRDPVAAYCELSVVQFDVGFDARDGKGVFEGKPVEGLRAVGPLWFDIVHLLVRSKDSDIHTAVDLCGKKVASGVDESGVKIIGDRLLDLICKQKNPVDKKPTMLPDGLNQLRAGTVDAVLWAGGSPTGIITKAIKEGLAVRALPLDGYLDDMRAEWRKFYPGYGDLYQAGQIDEGDYPRVKETDTIAVPNGVAVSNTADPEMVRFVAESLDRDRADFEHELWGDAQGNRHFLDAPSAVAGSLYCEVPLHPAAAAYYRTLDVQPPVQPRCRD
jgi:TRAP transporter TAXI family solute receptor